jgi:acyl carrier protein
VVLPGALPRKPDGLVDGPSVVAQFARKRGYLTHELGAWIVNRLCEVLYLTPDEFDPELDWARHGVDSAVALELLADLEDRLRVALPQALSECRNTLELAARAKAEVLKEPNQLPWWRSPWVTVEEI